MHERAIKKTGFYKKKWILLEEKSFFVAMCLCGLLKLKMGVQSTLSFD